MESSIEKKIVTIILLIVMFVGSFWSHAYRYADELIASVKGERAEDTDGTEILTYSEISEDYLSSLPFKREMIDINGALAKSLNMRELYRKSGGSVLKNGYIAGIYPYTTTDYEIQQITEFKSYLDERGIQLLYVNEPTKYIDDQVILEDLGKTTCINDNTDRFLGRLNDNGISYIDLRDRIIEENLDSFELFYRTDHHWTTFAGKMAAEAIAEELNRNYGYCIDLTLYDEDRFNYKEYKNAWLGEQGKKLGATFVGLDDFVSILPDYDTSFRVTHGESVAEGSFSDVLVDQERYLPENNENIYSAPSWHYSYMGHSEISGTKVENNFNTEGKKVLVLGDSYEQITIPFLALGVSEVQCLVLRSYGSSLREYIDNHEIDTVVIAYASFMIGTHDDETSANYKMFNFY